MKKNIYLLVLILTNSVIFSAAESTTFINNTLDRTIVIEPAYLYSYIDDSLSEPTKPVSVKPGNKEEYHYPQNAVRPSNNDKFRVYVTKQEAGQVSRKFIGAILNGSFKFLNSPENQANLPSYNLIGKTLVLDMTANGSVLMSYEDFAKREQERARLTGQALNSELPQDLINIIKEYIIN